MPEQFSEDDKDYVRRPKGCFTTGTQNEYGMGLELYQVGDKVYCDYAVPNRYRGFTKTAHGGIVCTLLDEIVVSGVSKLCHAMCATTEMTVKFRRPLHIDKPIQLQAWKTDENGERLHGHGQIVDGNDKIIAECEAEMVRLDPERAKRFMPKETAEKL